MHKRRNRPTKETIQRRRQTHTLCAIFFFEETPCVPLLPYLYLFIYLFIVLLNVFLGESHKINRKNGYNHLGCWVKKPYVQRIQHWYIESLIYYSRWTKRWHRTYLAIWSMRYEVNLRVLAPYILLQLQSITCRFSHVITYMHSFLSFHGNKLLHCSWPKNK